MTKHKEKWLALCERCKAGLTHVDVGAGKCTQCGKRFNPAGKFNRMLGTKNRTKTWKEMTARERTVIRQMYALMYDGACNVYIGIASTNSLVNEKLNGMLIVEILPDDRVIVRPDHCGPRREYTAAQLARSEYEHMPFIPPAHTIYFIG